ncbi:MAG: PAS domain S-box protein, partial [SAR324 cluster bacterium]|nr:PAS domain S-box protein [SAR324 cluster bacterium]
MDDNLKTREHLLEELDTLREKIAQLEQSHSVRIQAEEALLQSEKRFHLLIEHAADALFIISTDGKIIEVNQMACESLGYTRQELLSMYAWDFGEASDPKLQEEYIRTLPPGDTATIDGMHKRKDGGRFPVEVRLGALEVAGERFTLALARNVTERKLAEEGLRQSEERYRKIF